MMNNNITQRLNKCYFRIEKNKAFCGKNFIFGILIFVSAEMYMKLNSREKTLGAYS